jgi:hypothetical protein
MNVAHYAGMVARHRSSVTPVSKFLFGMTAAASLTIAGPSHADDEKRDHGAGSTHIAVDVDFSSALGVLGTKMGGGGALRVGEKFRLPLVSLTPELGGSYHAFGGDDETRIYRGFLGARLGVGTIVEPSIFAHVGVGHLEGLQTRTGTVLDAGLALDVTLLPLIDFGVHGGYNVMTPSGDNSAFKFLTLGLQVALVL